MSLFTKKCQNNRCNIPDPQPYSAFRKQEGMPDGLDPWCKACKDKYFSAESRLQRKLDKNREKTYHNPRKDRLCGSKRGLAFPKKYIR